MKLAVLIAVPTTISALRCFVCESRWDEFHEGELGDDGCLESPSAFEKECEGENDSTQCFSDLIVDWSVRGNQIKTIIRGCATETAEEGCKEDDGDGPAFKECYQVCDGDICNGENDELFEMFSVGEFAVEECHECHYSNRHGVPDGDESCIEGGSSIATTKCPKYADAGCFFSRNWNSHEDGDLEEDFRGCSTFYDKSIEGCQEAEDEEIDGEFETCRNSCAADNCNSAEIGAETGSRCFVCQLIWDEFGISVGDEDCLDKPSAFEADCSSVGDNEYSVCVSELRVDWTVRGSQLKTLIRTCGTETVEDGCEEDDHSHVIAYKDCVHTCDNTEGACNAENDDLFGMFSTGTVKSCHQCHYSNRPGVEDGDEECSWDFDENAADDDAANLSQWIAKENCPPYADSGCYMAQNWNAGDEHNVENEEDFRGCSTFGDNEHDGCADLKDDEGDKFETCRRICTDDNCNTSSATSLKISLFSIFVVAYLLI